MSIRDFAYRAAGVHTLTGGSTTCTVTGTTAGVGYMVGVKGHEEIVSADLSREALADVIEDYMIRHADALVGRFDNPRYVGTWEHEDQVFLDISEQFFDYAEAYSAAQARLERAIYDVREKREVRVAPQV